MTSEPRHPSSPLDDDAVRQDLTSLTVGGGVYMLSGQLTAALINFVTLIVLARLLSPREYGLVALVLVVTSFMSLFSDAGLPLATVQYQKLTAGQLSNLTWISGSIGALLTIFLLILARPLARFYDEPLVAGIAVGLAATQLFSGLTVQQWALMARRMRFDALAGIEVAAATASAVAGIVAALMGAAYWALVVRELAFTATRMAGVWLVSDWRPGLPSRLREMGRLVRFGGTFGLFSFQAYLRNNLDRFLIGTYLDPAQLGLYTRAFHLFMLPSRLIQAPTTNVTLPALSRLQAEPARFRRVLAAGLTALCWVTVPAAAIILVLAEDLTLSILGPQWTEAGPLLRILAIALVFNPVLAATGWLFTALGRPSHMLRWGLSSLPVFAIAFVLGLTRGAAGVAVGFVLAAISTRIAGLVYACRDSPVDLGDVAAACWKPYLLGAVGCLVMWPLSAQLTHLAAPLRLALAGSAGLAAFSLGAFAWPAARAEAWQLVDRVLDAFTEGRQKD